MANRPKVLVVDDMERYHGEFKKVLRRKVEIISAHSLEKARIVFSKSRNQLAAVVIDACIPGSEPNVLVQGFISEVRSQLSRKPIIGISFSEKHFVDLKSSGCTDVCLKNALPAKLCEVLDIKTLFQKFLGLLRVK